MLVHFKHMQGIKKLVLFVIAVIIALPVLGMIMEQHEYTIISNVSGVKVSFGGQSYTSQKSKKTQVAAPYSSIVEFTFPENKENTYSVSRENLPGDLIIKIRRFVQGEYTIFITSRETLGEEMRHIDVH